MSKYYISYYTQPGFAHGFGSGSIIKYIILETKYSMETEKGISQIIKQIRRRDWNHKGSKIVILSWHRLKQ